MVARTIPVPPFDLVVFGGTGDLARRKLIPALYHRLRAGQMPPEARVIAAARSDMDAEAYRRLAEDALAEFVPKDYLDAAILAQFLGTLDYVRLDATADRGWDALDRKLTEGDRISAFYLSVAPRFFAPICERLSKLGALRRNARIVVEKPLGRDLASARSLNAQLSAVFAEEQIYRIDHYLGKETVQNLMALRFANALFEPLWNARHVDHVQITVAESVGIEGRGDYYDRNGAMRDMVQNHLMQLLCLTAMEPPSAYCADAVRDEKLKVLKSLEPIDLGTGAEQVVRGQYRGNGAHSSALEDLGNQHSRTESFVAMKIAISNWRWSGTPFYVRTGKRLRARLSEIAVFFRPAPHSIFPAAAGKPGRNVLSIRLQPHEGITLGMTIKDPGPGGMRLTGAELDMTFAEGLGRPDLRMPDAYERLVMDVIRGDQTLFMRGDEVEAAWAWIDPAITEWEERQDARPSPYDSGSSGPEDALMLLHRDGRRWREIAA
ncbi:MAG: glucose-6-phosphate dehydrogenase [Pseudomonadota bacterium]